MYKHIYDLKGKYIDSVYDFVDDIVILTEYPNTKISNIKYIRPIIENGELKETYNKKMTVSYDPITKKVIEIKNGYFNSDDSLEFDYDNEVIQNQKYYYLNEDLELVFDEDLKNQDIELAKQKEKELKEAKVKTIEQEIKEKQRNEMLEKKIDDLTAIILDLMSDEKGGVEDEA